MSAFDDWFERHYPEATFASHMQVIRLSLKEVAEKAWVAAYAMSYEDGYSEGYNEGYDRGGFDCVDPWGGYD